MDSSLLPFDAPLERYRERAALLLTGQREGDAAASAFFQRHHPRFREPGLAWKERAAAAEEVAQAEFEKDDAELALARAHSFADWDALATYAASVAEPGSRVRRFEAAIEALLDGDLPGLDELLTADPGIVHLRSERRTCFDPPPRHRATLLHYLAANGVESHRQRSAPNAVQLAGRLFSAGADPDALAGAYGGEAGTLVLLVSSTPPATAGVQVPLIHALLDAGAEVEGVGSGRWVSPLHTALVFGFEDAALALLSRGAAVRTLPIAAGLGRVDLVREQLPAAPAEERHAAFALAAQLGRETIVALLLAAGEDPNRFHPDGYHAHGTPLHHAALRGHVGVVRLLLACGARKEVRDRIWGGTPAGWAEHGGHNELAAQLRMR